MKKYRGAVALVVLVLLAGVMLGCDNRSQLEKDVDSAAGQVKDALR